MRLIIILSDKSSTRYELTNTVFLIIDQAFPIRIRIFY